MMCGIIGYVGKQQAVPILLDGLQALEYRGYDSAGLATTESGAVRSVGKVVSLREKAAGHTGMCGIAHTRWATHGAPVEKNAHPHSDCKNEIFLVHNGVLENHSALKEELVRKGHIFTSETDTEVITHLLEDALLVQTDLLVAVHAITPLLRGSFALAVIHKAHPDTIVAVRYGSPLVIGIGMHEFFIASDATPLIPYTRDMVYLEDGESVKLTSSGYTLYSSTHTEIFGKIQHVTWDVASAQKSGYPHYMLKEIHEIPDALSRALYGRVTDASLVLTELLGFEQRFKSITRVVVTGCGTALYAGWTGAKSIEYFTGLAVEVVYASECRYSDVRYDENTLMIVLSQSGETADTRAAVAKGKAEGALTVAIVNVVGSSIAREVDIPIYMYAGPEIGVASTKAFAVQSALVVVLAVEIARLMGTAIAVAGVAKSIYTLKEKIQSVLARAEEVHRIAKKYTDTKNALFIGRKWSMPIALEGALKLKEVSYLHAEGYGAGEMKHGPLAMIDTQFPTIVIVPEDDVYEKTLSNISEIRARSGPVFAIGTEGDSRLESLVDTLFLVPKVPEYIQGILTVLPLHLLSYYSGVERGYNVDQPRNLAKSVTVE
ncbi:MAG: glutamine--fructose-6-phosphate transaminase (isomerizing) [Minisyncoccia bacterium]